MTRLLALVAAIAGGALIAWMAASHALAGGLAVDAAGWPGDLTQQFPDLDENESATRLLATSERFDQPRFYESRAAMVDYLRSALSSTANATPPPPPSPVACFLDQHANVIRTLRAQIVSNAPPVWPLRIDDVLDPPVPPLGLHMQLFTILATDALAQHCRGSDAAAWSDLRASWILARSLWQRPEVASVSTALAGTRLVAAVAVKLSPPVPPWCEETMTFDIMTPLFRSLQHEAWIERTHADRYPAGEPDESRLGDAIRRFVAPAIRPIRMLQAGIVIARLRQTATAAAIADPCAPFVNGMHEWTGVVRRFHRFLVEREGVAKFLDLEGRRAPGAKSVCKDASWDYRRDGHAIELAFRGTAPPQTSRIAITPLIYRLTDSSR